MNIGNLPYRSLIEIDRKSKIPIFRQLATSLVSLIGRGRLRSGFQLPPSREMAALLGLNRTTVIAAYEEMRSQGWLDGIARKGIFVSGQLPVVKPVPYQELGAEQDSDYAGPSFRRVDAILGEVADPGPFRIAVNDGYPDVRIAPMDLLLNRYRELLHRSYLHPVAMSGDIAGSKYLREELSIFLSRTRGLDIRPEHVLVTRGAQSAISLAASMLIGPGSRVVVASPNYVLADGLFRQLGAELIRVRVDSNGIDVDAIEALCKHSRPDLLYLIPHHHHPTTVTLSGERRLKLMDIVGRYGLCLIEDDYDYDFHYGNAPILPLASGPHNGRVIYIGSISKILAPTLRMGYLIGTADFVNQASRLKQLTESRGDTLLEEAVAHLFHNGEMQRHIRRSVQLYRQRRDDFCDQLKHAAGDIARFEKPAGGMAVWTGFPPGYSTAELSMRLAREGIAMNQGSRYSYDPACPSLRLGFASLNTAEMESFMRALQSVK